MGTHCKVGRQNKIGKDGRDDLFYFIFIIIVLLFAQGQVSESDLPLHALAEAARTQIK